ncbi:hypothetical protein [Paraburkholderia nodosa]|uniref:hypothetical protein n=1 Tax=Paraburkholderia nodosa TaxID=392320 RepID=UPI0012B6967E|nr:hypothetical protein [Paraburkholderia nodosa]
MLNPGTRPGDALVASLLAGDNAFLRLHLLEKDPGASTKAWQGPLRFQSGTRTIVPRPHRLRGNRVDSRRERYEVNVRRHPRQQIAQFAESLAVTLIGKHVDIDGTTFSLTISGGLFRIRDVFTDPAGGAVHGYSRCVSVAEGRRISAREIGRSPSVSSDSRA